ncbi:MAG: hypothetical protein WBQ94_16465 [Terracidiphilus sp.]
MKITYALLLLAGASIPASGQSEFSKQTVAVDPPFTLTISYNQQNPNVESAADQIVESGRWVAFRVRKTNISDREIVKMSHAGGSYGYYFEVRDSTGNLVGPRKPNEVKLKGDDRGAAASGTKDMVLQPGESKFDFLPLYSWFDMSAPGTYTIQALAHIADDPKSDVVKSNIITITVVAPKPEADAPK